MEMQITSTNLVRVIILDISGIYAQIHNQGYFDKENIEEIKEQYNDTKHWRVLVLDEEELNKTST